MKKIVFGTLVRETVVLGPEDRADLVASAGRRAGDPARVLSPDLARRSPGRSVGALAIMLWPPGAEPAIEAEHFADGDGALHAWWGRDSGEVGPYVAAGAGPCLTCVSAQRRVVEDGHDDTIAAWVAATVALQVRGLARIRKTEFVGISFLWSGRTAFTDTAGWDRRDHCAVPGCRDYRDSSITASRNEPYLDTFA
jgi:hypothetical protein